MELGERFTSKIKVNEGGCHVWIAGHSTAGYGVFSVNRKMKYAHRLSYEAHYGPIPEGLEIDHLCRNRGCVNPAHLEAVTHRENMLRGAGPIGDNARKKDCKYGHPLQGDNVYWTPDGRRLCRECRKAYSNAYYKKNKNKINARTRLRRRRSA